MQLRSIITLILLGTTLVVSAADPTSKRSISRDPKPKEVIRFDGNSLVLAFQNNNNGDTIKEYIPAGETLERWTKLAALYEYPNLDDPQAVVDALVARLKARGSDIPYDVRTDPRTKAVIVDFVIWPEGAAKPEDAEYVEYNIFRYESKRGGGLTAQQYAIRRYTDTQGFITNLRTWKDRLVQQMTNEGLTMPSGKSSIVE
jgi:hypothetical protein